MIKYTGLFDILNHRGMKKTDLRTILSSKTVAKLAKGEPISGDVIEKICLFLKCQPSDIMLILEEGEGEHNGKEVNFVTMHEIDYNTPNFQNIEHIGLIESDNSIDWIS